MKPGGPPLSTFDSTSNAAAFRASPQQQSRLAAGAQSIVQCAVQLPIATDLAALRAALAALVARHEILRTTIGRPTGMLVPQQVVHPELELEFARRELDPSQDRDQALRALLAAEAKRGFVLDRDPPLRAVATTRGDAAPLLVLSAPATCLDRESLVLLLDELSTMTTHSAEAQEPIQYADYAEWRAELVADDQPEAVEGRAFWHELMQDAAPRAVKPEPPGLVPAGGAVAIELEPAQLQRGADELRVTPAVFVEAAWHALLARLNAGDEVLMATWFDGRLAPDLAGAVGPYAQPVPVRTAVRPGTSFAEVADQLRRSRVRAERFQDSASTEQLATLLSLATTGVSHLDLSASPEVLALVEDPPPLSLLLALRNAPSGLSVELRYRTPGAGPEQAQELAARLTLLLGAAVADPHAPVAQLAITDAAERDRLLAVAAGPEPGPQATVTVPAQFARQAAATPDAPAVADAQRELSYRELDHAANRLAHRLAELGVSPGASVGLCMERTTAQIEALLAILKAGGAYVPLNYEHPHQRLAHQLSESAAAVLVTEAHLVDRFDAYEGTILCVDRDRDAIAAASDAEPAVEVGPRDPAYVMYTSGSTGLPKGVRVTHANLSNYAASIVARLGEPGPGLRFGTVSAISTDLGNTAIFPPLISGGCVQLVSPAASMSASALAVELAGRPLDVLKLTPSHLRALLAEQAHAGAVLPRRCLFIGGEALSWDLVQEIRALAPDCAIVNHYGPTETTVGCCAYDVGERRRDASTVPVGFPLAGVRAYVLDTGSHPAPVGISGELCIAGAGVADGYVGRAGDSSGPFVADPFAEGHMYRTGDRARRLADGALEFLGRIDDQVKIRGYRIEPGEIEAALVRLDGVRQAAVAVESDERGEPALVGYLVPERELTFEELREALSATLPEYMIPPAFATLDALPFTPSGKVDRRALAARAEMIGRRAAAYVAPSTPLQSDLAAIWAELLGVERVGVQDGFFALGGHSLLAARIVARVRSDLAVDLPLHSLFAHPTIARLSSEIVTLMGASEADETDRLMSELEGLSDEEAAQLLADET